MAGQEGMDRMTVTRADGCRRFGYMEEKGGLAGHILAVAVMLLARPVPPMQGVGTCSADDVGLDR